jgi:hypothetical protein
VPFDLNLPIDEDESNNVDDHSGSNDNSCGSPERSIDSLLCLADGSIDFKPFDFDKVADYMLQELSNTLRRVLGSGCTLEIDIGAMEQIIAAAWASEGKRPLQAWLDQVFAGSLGELKVKHGKHAISSTLRLVPCENMAASKEDGCFGGLLPSRIIFE